MDAINQPGWSSIRPWIPPLTLSVREITSVSVTFILSAATSDSNLDSELSLAAFGLSTDDIHDQGDESDSNDDEDTSNSESDVKKLPSVVSSALAGGLSVEVDRASWRRVFIKIDDKADEAVIIVYGLMPGRQYDIDLELVQGGHTNSIRRQVTTEESESKDISIPSDPDAVPSITSTYTDGSLSTTATSTPSTPPQANASPNTASNTNSTAHQSQSPSPGYGFAPLTLEDRLTQLQHTLSLLNNEQVSLNATIKTSRRDAQKADAALRSEIETLKRASERYAASELRAKQKVLALQEAVKQAQIATKDIHATAEEVEGELPMLNGEKELKEKEYREIKSRAEKIAEEREKEEEKERKRIEEMKSELAGLAKQIDKLESKKEKLDIGTVKDLEEELKRVEDEIERLQDEETFGSYDGVGNGGSYAGSTWGTLDESFNPTGPGTIGRPSAQPVSTFPIQRPGASSTITNANQPWASSGTSTTSPRANSNHHSHVHGQHSNTNHSHPHHNNQHNQRASSMSATFNSSNHHHPHHHHNHSHSHHPRHHQQIIPTPTTILTNPNRQSSLKSTTSTSSGGSNKAIPQPDLVSATSGTPSPNSNAALASSGSPGVTIINGTPSPISGSTLSSRALPFEPGRGILQRSGSKSKSRP